VKANNQSWDFILKKYVSLKEHEWNVEPMILLVEHIKAFYSNRLFAYTSLDLLIISIHPDIDRCIETLHIKFDRSENQFLFSYYSKSNKAEWERKYHSEDVNKKFDQFIKMINW
jgi:hypothetical protein